MTVTPVRKFARSPARQPMPVGKPAANSYDGEFYSSLAHLHQGDRVFQTWKGYDLSRKKSSTAEERRRSCLVEPITPVSGGAVSSRPIVLPGHLLTYRRGGNMKPASSITSLPTYLPDDSSRDNHQQCQATTANDNGSDAERNIVTVNYQSTRTFLGRKRSFRGKKVHRTTVSMEDVNGQKEKCHVSATGSEQNQSPCVRGKICAPGHLRIVRHSSDGATLTWDGGNCDSDDQDVLGYTVYVNGDVEAFVEGRQNRQMELFELQHGKLYKATVTVRTESGESSPSEPIHFMMSHTRTQSAPCENTHTGSSALSHSMPTLLDDDDDDGYSEYSYDIHGPHSLSEDKVSEFSPECCGQGRVTILHVRRKSSGSSSMDTSTPPSPQSDSSLPPSSVTAYSDLKKSAAKARFDFLHLPTLGDLLSRPVSAEPFMLSKTSSAESCRNKRVVTQVQVQARPASASDAPRRVPYYYCTAV